ncbi:hypothetical protein Scel_23950 [Streptomyces cellostaticus]|nr:hypothetical protein Scel_23950 [Streptomyces cellostaticus]
MPRVPVTKLSARAAVASEVSSLAAGNTVALKPSDTTPSSAALLARPAAEHLPSGVLNVVCGDRDTGRSLVAHPYVRLVAVTGSVRAGQEIAAVAAADLKRLHLELGGSAPVLVYEDADLGDAAEQLSSLAFYNAGQDCTAPTGSWSTGGSTTPSWASSPTGPPGGCPEPLTTLTPTSDRSPMPPDSSRCAACWCAFRTTPKSSPEARRWTAPATSTRPR